MAARKALNGFELMLRHYEPSNEENKVVFFNRITCSAIIKAIFEHHNRIVCQLGNINASNQL